MDLLLKGGLQAVTIDEVSARSGVAKTTIYRHWRGRSDLIASTFDLLLPPIEEPSLAGDTAAQLRLIQRSLAKNLRSAPWASALPALLEAIQRDPELNAYRERIIEQHDHALKAVIVEGAAAGYLDANLVVDDAVAQLAGPLLMRRLIQGTPLTDAFCDEIVAAFLDRYAIDRRQLNVQEERKP